MIRIALASVLVDDQEKALRFYTEVLGFVKKTDLPAGPFRWLTVVSPGVPGGTELVLEPNAFPPAATYQKALFDAGIPATAFLVDDVQSEYDRLKALGVRFRTPPIKSEWGTGATFEDTCGNLIGLHQA